MTQTPQIALIGTEASGKTVLTTILAKKLSQATSDGLCMIPIGAETAKYIEFAWAILQSGEWVPSTPAGKLFALH
jgi:adenylate kinase family enzyme